MFYVCYGEDIFLEIEDIGGYIYQWLSGDIDENIEFSEDWGNLFDLGEYLIIFDVIDINIGCSVVEGFLVIVWFMFDLFIFDVGGGVFCVGFSNIILIDNL